MVDEKMIEATGKIMHTRVTVLIDMWTNDVKADRQNTMDLCSKFGKQISSWIILACVHVCYKIEREGVGGQIRVNLW